MPCLAIDRWRACAPAEADRQPIALTAESAHGPRIVAVNDRAADAGVAAAMRLADARSLCPALQALPHDAAGDRQWIANLALWAQRWGPLTATDPPDALLIDIGGAVHLFGDEQRLCADAIAELAQRGFAARTGIAATPAAAWAMSHFAPPPAIIPAGGNPLASLGPLPVAALRLDDATMLLLARLGLKRIADLAGIDRKALARRFRNRASAADNPLIRLDQLLGNLAEPVLPVVANPIPLVQRRLAEPLLHRKLLDLVLADLADELAHLLEAERLGARRICLRAWRVDGDRIERQIELAAASREAAHILRLFATRLDDVDARFGIDQVQLLCPWVEPLALHQLDMGHEACSGTDSQVFVDRIVARLGRQAIARPVAHASHMPERSQRWAPPLEATKSAPSGLPLYARPLKLLARAEPISVLYATPEGLPRRFRWRDNVHEIARVEGPERIAPEWWREKSTTRLRDYYRIEDETGARYWIYRDGSLRDGRGGTPGWYLHGVFG